jgi:hypothetical protein
MKSSPREPVFPETADRICSGGDFIKPAKSKPDSFVYFVAEASQTRLAPLKYPPLKALLLLNVISNRRSPPPFSVAVAGADALEAVPLNPSVNVGSDSV